MIVLYILLRIVAAIVALAALLLLMILVVPVKLRGSGSYTEESYHASGAVEWFFIRGTFELRDSIQTLTVSFLSRVLHFENLSESDEDNYFAFWKPREESLVRKVFRVWHTRDKYWPVIKDIFKFFKELICSFSFERFFSHLVLGYSDPAELGMFSGYIYSSIGFLESKKLCLQYEPDFVRERLELDAELIIRLRLVYMVAATIRLVFRKSVLRLLWILVKKWLKSLQKKQKQKKRREAVNVR